MRILPFAAVLLFLGATGCSHTPEVRTQAIAPDDLSRMLSGHTMLVEAPSGWPYQTLMYFDPVGTGWADSKLQPGYEPVAGGMSMLISWHVTDADGLCTWSTPLIGDMPSNLPPFNDCIELRRLPGSPDVLQATFTRSGDTYTSTAQLSRGNSFPPGSMARYDRQVRALFGGHLPSWTLP